MAPILQSEAHYIVDFESDIHTAVLPEGLNEHGVGLMKSNQSQKRQQTSGSGQGRRSSHHVKGNKGMNDFSNTIGD